MSGSSEIREHIKSIRQTVKISSAQKLIAGAHIGKARKMLERSKLYHDRIRFTTASVLGDCEAENRYLDAGRDIKKRGLLVITADKGLAGGYNHNLMALAADTMQAAPVARLLAVGRVGGAQFSRMDAPLDKSFIYSAENPTPDTAGEIAGRMVDMFENGETDCFDVIYTKFRNAAHLSPVMERLFPLSPEALGAPKVHYAEYLPSADMVFETLIPQYLKGYLFGCLVQAWISELTSRINAMDGAIKNGNEMLDKLSLKYNRLRQRAITQEISEIVAGASSMEDEVI